jgi:hypothetical protein
MTESVSLEETATVAEAYPPLPPPHGNVDLEEAPPPAPQSFTDTLVVPEGTTNDWLDPRYAKTHLF